MCSLRGALGPREPVSLGLIFCGSVKLPIKYSSRLFNCRNKEQTASHQPFARTLYSIFSGPEPSTLKAAGGASVYTKSTATPDTFHRLMPRQGVVAWRCNPWRSRISGPRSLPRCWIWLVRSFAFHRTASIAFSRKKHVDVLLLLRNLFDRRVICLSRFYISDVFELLAPRLRTFNSNDQTADIYASLYFSGTRVEERKFDRNLALVFNV